MNDWDRAITAVVSFLMAKAVQAEQKHANRSDNLFAIVAGNTNEMAQAILREFFGKGGEDEVPERE